VEFRRLLLFILAAFSVLWFWMQFNPPQRPAEQPANGKAAAPDKPGGEAQPPVDDPQNVVQQADQNPSQRIVLGSHQDGLGYQLVVYFNSLGASIERAELVQHSGDDWKFGALEDRYGYLGYLGLQQTTEGCQVSVVAAGTPAAGATTSQGQQSGLLVGDLLISIDEIKLSTPPELDQYLSEATIPGQQVTLEVIRSLAGKATPLKLTTTLGRRPLEIVDPDPDDVPARSSDPSCLLSLYQLGQRKAGILDKEISSLPSLRNSHWKISQAADQPDQVEFRFELNDELARTAGLSGGLTVVKRYQLQRSSPDDPYAGYHLKLSVVLINHADQPQQVSYRLDGPNNLPLEGWWYAHKVQPGWSGAGVQDVIWQIGERYNLRTCTTIRKHAINNEEMPDESILPSSMDEWSGLRYVAVDTQFFSAGLIPGSPAELSAFKPQRAATTVAENAGEIEKKYLRTANVSFYVVSPAYTIEPGTSHLDEFTIFMGPKRRDVLASYGMDRAIYYGWFGFVARPLSGILHFFYSLFGNYAIAIILLTVLVRGCMFPISRKAARGAQIMQLMSPELKKLQEKFKDDARKKMQAQQDLFKKYNHNPFSGCLPMFLQLPIFLGLYRSIMVDVELRQAPLIPGVSWCSNLAGPDMLVYWENLFPFFTGRGSMFGPYLNVLPIAAIGMIILQQKMFMPPAQDDQQKMQQTIMKFMMILMGVLFFKIASGLCLYFVASGVWGVIERKTLPKIESLDDLPKSTPRPKRTPTKRQPAQRSRTKRRRLR
jgi:YidC/Oxa1 family membrane protein insertase